MDQAVADAIAVETYVYLYPLVTMEMTRRQATNAPAGGRGMRGPMNTLVHIRAFPTAEFRMVVRPNFDTLYSAAFLDLTDGPMVLSAPDTEGRYYMLPLMDMWTDVFAVPGRRTNGTRAIDFLVAPTGWTGDVPEGLVRIDSPTPYVWLIGRTQTNGPDDYAAVAAVQDGYGLQSLASWGGPPPAITAEVDPSIDMKTPPPQQVDAMDGATFFTLGAELMKVHPPHLSDWSQVERMRLIGLDVGSSFDPSSDDTVAQAVAAAPEAARSRLASRIGGLAKVVNGWQMNTDSMGVYGNFYDKRAIVAIIGLGANPPEDALYPLLQVDADGDRPDGSTDYVIHFDAADLPPVDAFWSITMYDGTGYQVANEINRFAIGDRDPLVYDADGSLDIYVQHTSPGADREANWLPSPDGPIGVTMRLYEPQPAVLEGRWAPPPMRKA